MPFKFVTNSLIRTRLAAIFLTRFWYGGSQRATHLELLPHWLELVLANV